MGQQLQQMEHLVKLQNLPETPLQATRGAGKVAKVKARMAKGKEMSLVPKAKEMKPHPKASLLPRQRAELQSILSTALLHCPQRQ